MTYSSPRKRIIASPSTLLTAEAPLSAYDVRDVVVNNLLHHADQACARVLVNYQSPLLSGKNDYISGADANGEWSTVELFGPFPLSVEQRDGGLHAYPLRVALSAGTDGTSHTYAVQLCLESFARPIAAASLINGGDVCTFAPTTTALGWLTPSTVGIINPQAVLSAPRPVATLTEESGDPVDVLCYMAFVRVLCIGASPRLYGLHVAEMYQ